MWDRTLGTDGEGSTATDPVAADDAALGDPLPRSDTVDVACWTPVVDETDDALSTTERREPRATLLAAPALPGEPDGPVTHTLVLEVDAPTCSVAVDYRPLDTRVVAADGVRVRTDGDDPVAVSEARVAADGTFHVTFADGQTDGAVFVEYGVSRNPSGGRHTVGVVVDGERHTEARLVVVG